MCELTFLPPVRQLSQGFDKKNPAHFYVGRFTKHYKAGQPFLGNPFKIGRDGNRDEVIAKYKQHLWERMQQDQNLRDWLRRLPSNAILFCHCSPLPCHADIILKAAQWMKQQPEEQPEEPPAPRPHAGDTIIPFGAHKGETLREAFEQNPGYLDWLASFVTYGSFKTRVVQFANVPYVKREIDRKYFNFDLRCGGSFECLQAFVPSEQTAKNFNLGKPTYLRPEYGPFKVPARAWNLTKNQKPAQEQEEYRFRSSLPITPTDWDGLTNEDYEENPRITKASEAWDIAADLSTAIDNAECIEELDLSGKIEQLKDWLPTETMAHLRQQFIAKRDSFSLLALIPDWRRRDALLALDAIRDEPHLEEILKEQAPDLHNVVELIRLS